MGGSGEFYNSIIIQYTDWKFEVFVDEKDKKEETDENKKKDENKKINNVTISASYIKSNEPEFIDLSKIEKLESNEDEEKEE